jgi:hypothetical protein
MVSKQYISILIAIIIVVVVIAGSVVYSGILGEKPNLMVTPQTFSGKTGETATLTFEINNLGGEANGVIIAASSPAFSDASTDKLNIPAHQTTTITCPVTVNDVESKDYPISLTYSSDGDLFGSSGNVVGNSAFHVVPSVEIVNVHWLNDVNWIGQVVTITQSADTKLYFNIKSNTNFAAEGINVKLTLTPTVANLVVHPSNMEATVIGPKATSEQISIYVASMSAPIGNHPLQIELLSDDYVIASTSTSIEVRG